MSRQKPQLLMQENMDDFFFFIFTDGYEDSTVEVAAVI